MPVSSFGSSNNGFVEFPQTVRLPLPHPGCNLPPHLWRRGAAAEMPLCPLQLLYTAAVLPQSGGTHTFSGLVGPSENIPTLVVILPF